LPDRRVRADHKSGFVGIVEQNFELAASALDLESVGVPNFLQAAPQRFKRGVAPSLKFLFVHGRDRVPRSRIAGKKPHYQPPPPPPLLEPGAVHDEEMWLIADSR
jgi:hypothetical protein